MKVKIMDVDLIRRYGNSVVNMTYDVAVRLEKQGKVKFIDTVSDNFKYIADDGLEIELKPAEIKKYPGPKEPIFPQIKS